MTSITQAAVEFAKIDAMKGVGNIQAMGAAADSVLGVFEEKIEKQIKQSEDATANFVDNLPEDYNLELVPEASKAKLSIYLKDQKAEYVRQANIAGKLSNDTSNPDYVAAVEAMEKIKGGMGKVYEDMQAAQVVRQHEISNYKGVTSLTKAERTQRDNFINGNVEFEFTLDGAYYTNPYQQGQSEMYPQPDQSKFYSKSKFDEDGNALPEGEVREVYEEDLYNTAMEKWSSRGITASRVRGKELKKSGLINKDVGNDVVTLQKESFRDGQLGKPRNLTELDNKNYYQGLFGDSNVAKQIAFLGMPYDNNNTMRTRYIDHYIAEQAILGTKGFENIKVVDKNGDGKYDEGDYFEDQNVLNAKIDELRNDPNLDLSQEMTEFFTAMSMTEFDNGAGVASEGTETTPSEIKVLQFKQKEMAKKVKLFAENVKKKKKRIEDPRDKKVYTWSEKYNGYLQTTSKGYKAAPEGSDQIYAVFTIDDLTPDPFNPNNN